MMIDIKLMDPKCRLCIPPPVVTAAVTLDAALEIPAFLRRDNGAPWDWPDEALPAAPRKGLYEPRKSNLTERDKEVIEMLQRQLPSSAEQTSKRLSELAAKHPGQRYDRKLKKWVDVGLNIRDSANASGRLQGVSERNADDSKPGIDAARLPEGYSNYFE